MQEFWAYYLKSININFTTTDIVYLEITFFNVQIDLIAIYRLHAFNNENFINKLEIFIKLTANINLILSGNITD